MGQLVTATARTGGGVIGALPWPAMLVDHAGTVVAANPAWLDLTTTRGWWSTEVGRGVFGGAEDPDGITTGLSRVLRHGVPEADLSWGSCRILIRACDTAGGGGALVIAVDPDNAFSPFPRVNPLLSGLPAGPDRSETDRLTDIIETQQAIGSASLEIGEVMQRLADRARDLLQASGAAVLVGESGRAVFRATSGAADVMLGEGIELEDPLVGKSLRESVALRTDDSEVGDAASRDLCRRMGVRSMLTVPLRDGRRTIGVLAVVHVEPSRFSDGAMQTLLLIGGLLSAALVRALAFDANQRLLAERTATLGALRESEERLRSAMDAAQIGVWDWDVVHGPITWLGHLEDIFGFEPGGFDGRYQTFIGCVHQEDRQELERALTAALNSAAEFSHSYRVVWPDGTIRWVLGRGQYHYDGDGRPTRMVGAIMDVTERRELEHQVLQSQKIEAIGQLAAGIAHEINTPTQYVGDNLRFLKDAFEGLLRVVMAYRTVAAAARAAGIAVEEAESAWSDADGGFLIDEVPRAASQALDGVERVSSIVRAMKEFSHPGGDEKIPVDLNRAIENTISVSRNEWKYVADMELRLAPELPQVPCRVGQIQQVVLNLVVNAAHAIADVVEGTDQKGTITVTTAVAGDMVEIRVRDTGTGMTPAVQARAFDPFFTTKEVGRGTGQGLALSRDVVVKKHRGTLTLESELGKGTTFLICLPLHPEDLMAGRP